MTLRIAKRDRDILTALTRRVRVLSLAQIGRTWFNDVGDPADAARRRIVQFAEEGLVTLTTAMAHPELPLEGPQFTWRPGDPDPEFGQLAYRLQSRWCRPVQPTTLVLAAKLANKRFGGYVGGRPPRRSEVTHDLHLAAVYLWFLEHRPALAKRWVSEHEQYALGGGRNARLPDAIVPHRHNRQKDLVIEFGGAYAKSKLQEFHEELNHLAYQIW
jgi:hypothetical protein